MESTGTQETGTEEVADEPDADDLPVIATPEVWSETVVAKLILSWGLTLPTHLPKALVSSDGTSIAPEPAEPSETDPTPINAPEGSTLTIPVLPSAALPVLAALPVPVALELPALDTEARIPSPVPQQVLELLKTSAPPPPPNVSDERLKTFAGEIVVKPNAPVKNEDLEAEPLKLDEEVSSEPAPTPTERTEKPQLTPKAQFVERVTALPRQEQPEGRARHDVPEPVSTTTYSAVSGLPSHEYGPQVSTPSAAALSSGEVELGAGLQSWRESLTTTPQIAVRLSNGDDQSAVVRMMERAGKISVSVSANDAKVAVSLNSSLSELTQNLDNRGYHAALATSGTATQALTTQESAAGNNGNNPFAGGRQDSPDQNRPDSRRDGDGQKSSKKNFNQLLQHLGRDQSSWPA